MYAVPDPERPDIVEHLDLPSAITLCTQVGDGAPPGRCHAVVVAERDGTVGHRLVLEGVFTVDHAVGWAAGLHQSEGWPVALLISVVDHRVDEPDLLDQFGFERNRRLLASLGIELRDWLLDDGDDIRSMAFTVDPETAWPDAAPFVRHRRGRLPDPGLMTEDD